MLKLENSIRGLSFSRVAFDLTIQAIKKALTSDDVRAQHGGGLGIRTLATVTRPNDLANRPLQPLE